MYIYILKIYSYILCDLHFSDKWLSVSNMADFQVSARNTEGGKGLLKYRQDSVMWVRNHGYNRKTQKPKFKVIKQKQINIRKTKEMFLQWLKGN